MEFSDIFIILLIIISIILFALALMKRCPECINQPIIVYKKFPELDLQFSPDNYPTKVYNDVFTGNNPWLGGYSGPMNTASRIALGQSSG